VVGVFDARMRPVSASLGVAISEDPIQFEGGGANFFRWEDNGPVNRVDPSGQAWWVFSVGVSFVFQVYDSYRLATGQIGWGEYWVMTGINATAIVVPAAYAWRGGRVAGAVTQVFRAANELRPVFQRIVTTGAVAAGVQAANALGHAVSACLPRPIGYKLLTSDQMDKLYPQGYPPGWGIVITPQGTFVDVPVFPVPGGSLAAHEAAGGHTIAKHVGQTDAQLRARNLPRASTFADRVTAELAIDHTIAANQTQIGEWLTGSGNELVVTHSMPISVGTSLTRGAAQSTNVSNVRVILRRDPGLSTGYRVHTAYPEP